MVIYTLTRFIRWDILHKSRIVAESFWLKISGSQKVILLFPAMTTPCLVKIQLKYGIPPNFSTFLLKTTQMCKCPLQAAKQLLQAWCTLANHEYLSTSNVGGCKDFS